MTSRDSSSGSDQESVPFGALEPPAATESVRRRGTKRRTTKKKPTEAKAEAADAAPSRSRPDSDSGEGEERTDWRDAKSRRGTGRRGGRRRRGSNASGEAEANPDETAPAAVEDDSASEGDGERSEGDRPRRRRNRRNRRRARDGEEEPRDEDASSAEDAPQGESKEGAGRTSRSRKGGGKPGANATGQKKPSGPPKGQKSGGKPKPGQAIGECEGLLVTDKGGHGKLRQADNGWLADNKNDVHVGPKQIQKFGLREGSVVKGRYGAGFGKHKFDLYEVTEVDGRDPKDVRSLQPFKNLTSIDPDFHYEVGDFTDDTCLRVVDMICPVGRGQRGLIVAPPRTGKTTLLRKFANAIEEHYPDVHLMVLLVDERPEEATDWKRSTKGDVFVSTNDEMPKKHVDLCEVVWARCCRLVELGEDVILLLDSITRMARAYNNVKGNSGKTMSGGLDSRAMERPKQFFGSARNTETAGSLTILGTTLIETGSQMDKVIFEEFKGTGNMELVLSRKLADRRIFPAIDLERSGTRKEEKLLSSTRLRRISTLRRVLMRMNFIEAMELLVTKLDDVERNDEFLQRFDVDPEA
ncbi:MAG: transcription termination factor Rho [Planctomycetota bacterium]